MHVKFCLIDQSWLIACVSTKEQEQSGWVALPAGWHQCGTPQRGRQSSRSVSAGGSQCSCLEGSQASGPREPSASPYWLYQTLPPLSQPTTQNNISADNSVLLAKVLLDSVSNGKSLNRSYFLVLQKLDMQQGVYWEILNGSVSFGTLDRLKRSRMRLSMFGILREDPWISQNLAIRSK